jgi:hypothetical protein
MDGNLNKKMSGYKILSFLNISRELTIGENEEIPEQINYDNNMYMFEECKRYEFLHSNQNIFNGTCKFPIDHYPDTINWYSMNSILIHDYDDDDYPISTLQYLIDYYLNAKNISVSGYVIQIDLNESQVFYYNIVNQRLILHINKSMDLSDFWKDCKKYYIGENTSQHFVNILMNNLHTDETYTSYIHDVDEEIDIFERFYEYAL